MDAFSFTVEQVIARTSIRRTQLYSYINAGRLRAKKSGRRTIILAKDLEEFLDGLQSYSTPEKV